MNKVFNINLGGYPFTIDENAYDHLSSYLRTIHSHFRQSEGYEEITSDIESRLAEIFRESLGSRPIVTLRDVEDAIAVMGTPEDFGAEPVEDTDEEQPVGEKAGGEERSEKAEKEGHRYRTGRRLFRNPDDEVVGGVCSGIASYFGIQDPLWVRLVFVLMTISGGFGIPLYLILWAILPKAESASDRLSMRGEPINVSNIGKIIEEEMENFSSKMSDFGDEFGTSWKSSDGKKKRSEARGQVRAFLKQFFAGLGKVIQTVITVIANIWKPILFIVMVALLIAFAVGWIGAIIGLFFSMPLMDYVMPNAPFIPVMGVIGLMIAAGIPILMSAFGIGRRLFRFKVSNYVQAGFWGIWILSLVALGFSASKTAQQFQDGSDKAIGTFTDFPDTDTLYVSLTPNDSDNHLSIFNQMLHLSGNQLSSHQVVLNVRKAEGNFYSLDQEHSSRGVTTEEAGNLAEQIDYRHWVEGNVLHLDQAFPINRGNKWRAQQVHLTLYIPEGKTVIFQDRNIQRLIRHVDMDRSMDRPWSMYSSSCSYWKMGENGLYCPDYVSSLSKSRTFDGTGYSRIHIDGNLELIINYGEEYSLDIVGRENDVEKVDIRQLDDLIDISVSDGLTDMPVIKITTPVLEHLDASQLASLEVFGFEGNDMEFWLEGVKVGKIFAKPAQLSIRQSGRSQMELRGEAQQMDLRLEGYVELDAGGFTVAEANVNASGPVQLEVWVTESLQENLTEDVRIEVKGEPVRTGLEQ